MDAVKSCHDGRPVINDLLRDSTQKNFLEVTVWLLDLCHKFPDLIHHSTGEPFVPTVLSQTFCIGEYPLMVTNEGLMNFDAITFISSGPHIEEKASLLAVSILHRVLTLSPRLAAARRNLEPGWQFTQCHEIVAEACKSQEEYDLLIRKQRRMFTTDNNHICWCSLLMEEGNLICLIYGATVPFLLRRRVEGGHCLGQCYVHGLMFGESMSMGVEQDTTLH